MFKKFIVLTLALSIFMVQANASTHNGLKEVFDELNYSLTVEWDQKDQAFYDKQMESFTAQVEELHKRGVSHQEIIEYALTQVKDERMAKDLRTTLTLVAISKMSPNEARGYVKNIMDKSYSRGASWVGQTAAGVLAVFILVAIAGLVTGLAKVENGCYKFRKCDETCAFGGCYQTCDYECWY